MNTYESLQTRSLSSEGAVEPQVVQSSDHRQPQAGGNQAIQRALRSGAIRAKLAINQQGDVYEQEADRVAEQVMRMPVPHVQRQCACGGIAGPDGECESCRQRRLGVQRQAAGSAAVSDVPSSVHDVINWPGQPLDLGTRAFFEPRFGADFSDVRVHTDTRAAESARKINARAYTVGSEVVFGEGQYTPGGQTGERLLAHELTHVVQQRGELQSSQPSRDVPAIRTNYESSIVIQRGLLDAAVETVASSLDEYGILLQDPLETIFDGIVIASLATSSPISIPWGWRGKILEYIADSEGELFGRATAFVGLARNTVLGLARMSGFHRGGLILQIQSQAAAMTLDRHVFVCGSLTLSTFFHELIHVAQYAALGSIPFLIAYFGTSAAVIAYRWARGLPINEMDASPFEWQAYGAEEHFKQWHIAKYGSNPDSIVSG